MIKKLSQPLIILYYSFVNVPVICWVTIIALYASAAALVFSLNNEFIISYGDAESHLNIAKRVVNSLTPGFSQLGGIWLPLPHILMVPFIWSDLLWRTGLAGAIVSAAAYVIASIFIYKLVFLVTRSTAASFLAFLAFATNPNVLYMQSTPMTELTLICFFVLSTYFFMKFLYRQTDYIALIFAGIFGLCATLSRYDGWLLVLCEATIIGILYFLKPKQRALQQGNLILFSLVAFLGIALWFVWDGLILGDPFYFKNSAFSANSQQQGWLAKGELPAYHNLWLSFLYYFFTAMQNAGIILFAVGGIGVIYFLIRERKNLNHHFLFLILCVPFIFYVLTLFIGQSVIFIPGLTPDNFEWNLFNVRYGLMMVPTTAFFYGYLASRTGAVVKGILVAVLLFQIGLYTAGRSSVVTWEDGVYGLSATRTPDALGWINKNYDGGLVLLDDYARTISIARSTIPMQSIIYIGNKPYWDESLIEPEKYARWIVMQKNDSVWNTVYENPVIQARLYKYFEKAYTSQDILIFKRNDLQLSLNH